MNIRFTTIFGWVVNKRTCEVKKSFVLRFSLTNYISLEDLDEDPDLVFYAKGFLGIPIYVSEDKTGHCFEHTHRPLKRFARSTWLTR